MKIINGGSEMVEITYEHEGYLVRGRSSGSVNASALMRRTRVWTVLRQDGTYLASNLKTKAEAKARIAHESKRI